MIGLDVAERIVEIRDLAGGGLRSSFVTISQDIPVAKLVRRVSSLLHRSLGTFELLLMWDRNKVNLMKVRNDLMLADLGVDFTSDATFTLLIGEWSPSSSETERLVELNDKETQESNEGGVDLSSPSKAMLLVEMTSESPTNDTETEAWTPTENNTMESIYPNGLKGLAATLDSNVDNVMNPTAAPEETAPSPNADVCNTDNSVLTFASDYTFFQHRNKNIDIGGRRGWDKDMSSNPYKIRRALEDTEESEPTRTDENGYVGLVNQAMTCYLNSLIQALYMTPEFRNALYNWEYIYDSDKDEAKSIPYQLQKLFLNLQTSSKNAIETTSLTKSFGWDSTQAWQQHDIQELCRVMFDALEQKFKNTEQADLINRLYEGKMIDYVKCLECGTEKSREDTFLDIPLPVRPFGSNVAYNSVEEALGAFVQPETLDGTNQYHCETCNKKCDAHKGLKFTKFPYFLTLHLKRFDFDYNTFHRIKLNDEVTFPDVLNLNSFIPSATTEDSTPNEESSNATKSQVAATTNSGTQENPETPPPCNNGISGNENPPRDNHRVNDRNDHDDEDDDEDEGIERNNEPSTSTCNSRNHDHLKNRDNAPGPKGPYMYELFSIMIHSGSASGGHYFAYIKDFRTGKWLCFNDQNVSTITYDDIQRTYGGGPARAYYSGVYSSSSNAYMLMYRQIDPARNALPMQVADFPKHLQELMKMQESEYNNSLQDDEYNDTKNRGILMRRCRHSVFCHHPVKKTTMGLKLICFRNATVAEVTERAYKRMNLEGEVDRDQVRLVTYQENTGLVDCSFEGREHEPLISMLNGRPDLFLEVRNKGEAFKPYLPRGFARHAYVVDFATNEVTKGPIIIYGHVTQTVQEYKEQLGLAIGMEPKDIKLVVQYLNDQPRLITSNESTLQDEGFVNASRIFVATASGPDSKKILENIYEIFFLISNLILLNVHLPDLSEDELLAQGIPTLLEKRLAESTPLTNGPPKLSSNPETTKDTEKTENNETTTKPSEIEEPSTLPNKTPSPAVQTETEDWHTPEQSNSEDSSLSYSDRTLVGEGDASEDDDYPLANVDHEIFSQSNQDNGQVKYPSPYLVRVMRDEQEPHKLIRVLCEKRMGLSALKKVLEPHVGVPAEYFKVYCQQDAEIECTRLPLETSQDDTASIWLKLGLALRNGEIQVSLFHLCTDSETEPFRFLCEWVVSKEATVGQAKKEILAHLKKKFHIDIPFERCRLRRKTYKTAANVYLDDKKVKDLKFYWREIIVQELPGKETITNDTDVAIFARRMPRSGVGRAPLEELVVSGKSLSEIREKISAMSDIPDEHLEIAKGKSSLPDDVMPLVQHKLLEWHRQGSTDDDFETPCLDDGTIIYYRDSRELPQELIFTDKPDIDFRPSKFYGGASSSLSRSSRRGERALKIYLDDM